jgi:hypothetical protein
MVEVAGAMASRSAARSVTVARLVVAVVLLVYVESVVVCLFLVIVELRLGMQVTVLLVANSIAEL